FPCDIEWAFEKGEFYITQSRPITTLSASDEERQKENWLVVVSFKTELLTEAIIHKGYRESLSKLLPQIPKFRNRMIIDNDIYIDLTETSKIQEYFSSNTVKKAGEVYKAIEWQSKDFIRTSKEYAKNAKGISDKELSARLHKFFKAYEKTVGAIGIPTIIDLTIEAKLKSFLKESRVENVDEILAQIAIPHKLVETSKEKLALLTLAKNINNQELNLESRETMAFIRRHYRKYGWLHSTLFLGKLYDEQYIKKEVVKIGSEADRKIDELENDREEHLLSAEKAIEEIHSANGRKLAKFFQKAVYYRTARLEWMNEACFVMRPLLEEAAERLQVSFNDIIYLLPEELTGSLNNSKIDSNVVKSAKERQKGYAYISDNEQEYLLVIGNELEEWKQKFSKNYKQGEGAVKGIVAFKGIAKGKAVIVKDRDDLHKVREGDVLIARLTTPDFIIAMKKACAIVTDLGGITSHAAITSRELKIPCVVGTKNST
ncbi:MAG: PEP-utilizing enzyme, partial [Patescibacteria group bacterium]